MAEAGFQEKTEKATPKRRADARKKGQVAQSREVPSVLILLAALGVFFFRDPVKFFLALQKIFLGVGKSLLRFILNPLFMF